MATSCFRITATLAVCLRLALIIAQCTKELSAQPSAAWMDDAIISSLFARPYQTLNQIREMDALKSIVSANTANFTIYQVQDFAGVPPLVYHSFSLISQLPYSGPVFAILLLAVDVLIAFFIHQIAETVLLRRKSSNGEISVNSNEQNESARNSIDDNLWDAEEELQLRMPNSIAPQNSHIFPCFASTSTNVKSSSSSSTKRDERKGKWRNTAKQQSPLLPMEQLPSIASLLYFASPISMLSSQYYGCYQNIPCMLVLASIHLGLAPNSSHVSGIMLALAAYIEPCHMSYAVPIILLLNQRQVKHNKQSKQMTSISESAVFATSFVMVSIILQAAALAAVGTANYARIIELSYGMIWKSIRPSLSVLWYFHMQLFDRFRSFYAYMILGLPYLLVLPLAKRLSDFPVTLIAAYWMIFTVYRPTQTLFDFNIALSLMLWNPHTLARMSSVSVIAMCSMMVPVLLYVVDSWMWLHAGSGNANFIFFQCLAYNAFVGIVLAQFCSCSVQRRKALSLTKAAIVTPGEHVKVE